MTLIRYVVRALSAALAGMLAGLGTMALLSWFGAGTPSSADLAGFGVLSFAFSLVLILALHTPVLAYARRKQWTRRRRVAVAVLAVNAPAYLVLVAGLLRGGQFGGVTEVLLFVAAFAVSAAAFAATQSRDSA